MSSLILRLVSGWYDPAEQQKRERRTDVAHKKAIAVRQRSEIVGERIQSTRESYDRAGTRLTRRR